MKMMVEKTELEKLASAVEELISCVPISQRKLKRFEIRVRCPEEAYRSPAELLVAAALVNQTRYQSVVVPRLRKFRSEHRGLRSVSQLRRLVDSKSDEYIYRRVLHLGKGQNPRNFRARLLRGLARAFDEYARKLRQRHRRRATDYEVLRTWAREPNPFNALQEANGEKIAGLGPKLVDWLRMFGGDVATVPSDVYTIEGMKKLGLGDPGETAAFVARLFGLSPYALDVAFRPPKRPRNS